MNALPLALSPRAARCALFAALAFAALPAVQAKSTASAPVSVEAVASAAHLTQVAYLSGHGPADAVDWDFLCTGGRRSGEWSKIRVPSCWEQEGFGTYNYGMAVRDKPDDFPGLAREKGHYRRRFSVPADWQGRAVRIVFDGVMTDAEVRINGQLAGPVHQGAFYRFRHDISSLLNYGVENVVEVVVLKESENRSVNEAERRGDYWNFGGIFRPVFLEALPAAHIERLAADAKADGTLSCDVFVGAGLAGDTTLSAELVDASGKLAARIPAQALRAENGRQRLTVKVPGVRTWTAETPNLYTLRVTLAGPQSQLHTVSTRVGFRTIEVRNGDGVYVNGHKVIFKGVNRHAFRSGSGRTLSPADDLADVRLMKGMNMNAVRCSHYPQDASFLEACDEQGLYVLDELAGWHGLYDTTVGRKLLREMVEHNVNHPSIVFWDNGNEMGWNPELDGDFAKLDPQGRPVLHPLGTWSGINTFHYRSYEETKGYLERGDIFMPTEFLHGLYDGGHGAGLHDYWQLMGRHPRSAGGFLWVLADEGLRRTDQDSRIDAAGSWGPDGIVGPNHEKEGSYETIREVWNPVVVGPEVLPADFKGTLNVENRYDFVSLDQCRFSWKLVNFGVPGARGAAPTTVAEGSLRGPAIASRSSGTLTLPLPADFRKADALLVTAHDATGHALWTQSWSFRQAGIEAAVQPQGVAVVGRDDGVQYAAHVGNLDVRWDKDSGELATVLVGGSLISLGKGPRLIAAHRMDRQLDGSPVTVPVATDMDRHYTQVAANSKLVSLVQKSEAGSVILEATYEGALRKATWRLAPDGTLYLDCDYTIDGVLDLLGLSFAYPENRMRSVRWLGMGPYRVWQNRLHGTSLNLWENDYNDAIPGANYAYPEFKGYFRGWQWASFGTNEGTITLGNRTPGSYLGVYAPKDGGPAPHLCVLPEHGLGIFEVIPAMRNKVNATELVGPSSQPVKVSGMRRLSLAFRFGGQ